MDKQTQYFTNQYGVHFEVSVEGFDSNAVTGAKAYDDRNDFINTISLLSRKTIDLVEKEADWVTVTKAYNGDYSYAQIETKDQVFCQALKPDFLQKLFAEWVEPVFVITQNGYFFWVAVAGFDPDKLTNAQSFPVSGFKDLVEALESNYAQDAEDVEACIMALFKLDGVLHHTDVQGTWEVTEFNGFPEDGTLDDFNLYLDEFEF